MEQQESVKFSELAGFQNRQKEASLAVKETKYTLFGGAAGGGKSYFLRWQAVKLLMYFFGKYNIKGVRVGLFCEDYPALKERHLSKIPYEFPEWLGTLNKADHEFRLADAYGGGVIAFRNLDDPSKYLSSEFAAVLVDELTKNKREVFDFLNMRMRWPGIADTRFVSATNPGEIGHGWVKKLWISKDFKGETFDPKDFKFVQSKYTDNKYIDKSYEKQLDSLPVTLRRAYKDGDWEIFAGQYFTEFNRESHVCTPFELPEHFVKFAGLDYGYTAPSAIIWCAYDKAFDTVYVYDELYATGLTYKDLANKIKDKTITYYADPSIWAKKDKPQTGFTEMTSEGINLLKGNNDRIAGWNMLRVRLKVFDGKTKIRIFSNCKELIRSLPELVHDKNNVEDCDSSGDDHCADALRYAVATFNFTNDSQKEYNKVATDYIQELQGHPEEKTFSLSHFDKHFI